MPWPGFEPTTSRSEVDDANHYTIEASYQKEPIFHVESYNILLFWGVEMSTYNVWSLEIRVYISFFVVPLRNQVIISS